MTKERDGLLITWPVGQIEPRQVGLDRERVQQVQIGVRLQHVEDGEPLGLRISSARSCRFSISTSTVAGATPPAPADKSKLAEQEKWANDELSLTGKVLAVDSKYEFVVLNIGGNQGVAKNGKLLVHRDGKLVAKLRVTNVECNSSIANRRKCNFRQSRRLRRCRRCNQSPAGWTEPAFVDNRTGLLAAPAKE